ncbi:MFS transporter [Saccharopolyspora erythraea]|uniref:MFS transporter n=1 Tax=Saccharopolyspora erythraea TaxID=1836 RepID=UPI001BAB7108|nr:MFS transporter [Saccharopolyspora erythraea]QUH04055.1 MFS transporter [Saccharopolyspora erythraea]
MRIYTNVLAAPHAKHLIISNLVGRLPNGMGALAIVLFLRGHEVGYLPIGVLTAAYALASAIGGPVLGRLVDHHGQPTVLTVAALGSGAGFALLAMSEGNLIVAGVAVVIAGLLTPPLEPCLRSLWPSVLPSEAAVAGAYALDAALQEVIFVAGPLLVIGVISLAGETGAVWVTGLVAVAGTLAFVAARPVRTWRAEPRTPHWAGPLRSAPLRVLLVSLLCVGTAIGVLNIVAAAYGEHVHQPGLAGYLLGANALGALIGGLVYGARAWPGTNRGRMAWLLGALAVCYWPLASVAAPPVMLGLALISGLFLAPVLACGFVIVGEVAPTGTVTEAFAWVVTIFVAGNSLGSAVAGVVVQNSGLGTAFLLPAIAGTAAAAVVALSSHYRSAVAARP